MERDDDPRQATRKRDLADRSDEILTAVQDLRDMERLKRTKAISTPPFHALADDIQAKSREIFRIASAERALGDEIDRGSVSIEDVEDNERS